MTTRRRFSAWAALAATAWPLAGRAADAYPERSIRLLVGYPAGGGVDFVARALARRLGEILRQPVVVENRAGASGSLAADAVAKSRADGYTLLLASPGEVIAGPIAGQKTPYDPVVDLVAVALAGETPLGIAVHPSVAAADLPQLLAAARGPDSRLSFGTPGAGSTMHFAGESLNQLAGVAMLHVPYRGAAPAVTDLIGNQVPMVIVGLPPLVAQARQGRLRLLAVTTEKRSTTLPEVPAVAELPGMKGFHFSNWMGLFAPARTPASVVDLLGVTVRQVVSEPAVREQLLGAGVEPAGLRGADFDAFLRSERQRYQAIAKSRQIRFAD